VGACPAHFPVPCAPIPISAFSILAFQLFASWPVEQRALALLLAGGDFDDGPDETGLNNRSALSHLGTGQLMV
jgi:hypothetical protein